ncbi:MAG: DUF6526 family protein [Candidatus Hydrogenedentota bacterium]
MSDQPVQNFENHVRHDKLGYIYFGALLVSLILAVVGFFGYFRLWGVATLINTAATMLLAVNARTYGLKDQDRIIRLEMRLRLRELLPADLKGRVMDFTMPQLAALRFASDAELPELARRVLSEDITKGSEIKKLVKNWQADFNRV